MIQREHIVNIDTQETMAQFTERLKEELAAEELCRQANMTDVDTIDDLVELYRPRSQGDMSDSSGRDGSSLVPLADDTNAPLEAFRRHATHQRR